MAHTISPPGRVAAVVLIVVILWLIPGVAPGQGSITIPKDATYEGTGYSALLGRWPWRPCECHPGS